MSGLSNFLLRRDDGIDLHVRPVKRDEVEPAMRLILSGTTAPGGDGGGGVGAVADFLRTAMGRGLDPTAIWVIADARDALQWAALPMTLAGRALLLMLPPRMRPGLESRHVAELVASSLIEPRRQGVTLAQTLVDPEHRAVARALVDGGFEEIAELIYLSRTVRNEIRGRILPERYRLWRYDRATHYRFGACIERTYAGSLDCPKLNGRRATDDIIAGHKAAGEFDPELWMLLSDLAGDDLGVLLLNRLSRREGFELVYVGLVPEARGRGLADPLIRTAINALAREGGGQLLTACDALNAPARKLYYRHGFGQLYARRALVRELGPP